MPDTPPPIDLSSVATPPGAFWPSSEECACPMCQGARLIRSGTDEELRAGVRELIVERRRDGTPRYVVRTVEGWSSEVTQEQADRIMRARDAFRDDPDAEARRRREAERLRAERRAAYALQYGAQVPPRPANIREAMRDALRATRNADATVTVDMAGTEARVAADMTNPEEVLRNRWSYSGTVTEPLGQTFEDGGAEYKVTGGVLIGTGRPASRRLRVIAKNLATGAEKTFDPAHVAEALMPQARSPSRGGTPRRRPARRPPAPRPTWYVVEPSGRTRRLPASFHPGESCANIREYIGGYADRHSVAGGGGFVWVNEDGITLNLPQNVRAGSLWGRGGLVGTVVFEVTGETLRARLEEARRLTR